MIPTRCRVLTLLLALVGCLPAVLYAQQVTKVVFDASDSVDGYYLAVRPRSNTIKGVLVLLDGFSTPEATFGETKLPNVASANDLLTVLVSTKRKIYGDAAATARLSTVLQHVARSYPSDTARFALVGRGVAGTIALRYVELTQAEPARFSIHPRAVVAVNSAVDVFGLWRWSERQIAHRSRSAGEAQYLLDTMTGEQGAITAKPANYEALTPFHRENEAPGNEQFLRRVPVRLYYDVDLASQLRDAQRSLYDTNVPDGSELIRRLLVVGNRNAELVTATRRGINSDGVPSPNAWSIVEEVECVHWLKNRLGIFDPHSWVAPYAFQAPADWQTERIAMPIDFAPQIPYTGVEDVRFAPGWADGSSPQYWSYAYLWWIVGAETLDAVVLRQHLHDYYTGLVARNIVGTATPPPTDVHVQLDPDTPGPMDRATYRGTISMFDYMARRPIRLQYIVHVKSCAAQQHTAVVVEVSPQPSTAPVWKDLDHINARFDCDAM